jgi:hypothetical protein
MRAAFLVGAAIAIIGAVTSSVRGPGRECETPTTSER